MNADHAVWVALGISFETALEVERAVKAVKERLWNGFGTRFSIDAFFRDVRNEITTFASQEDAQIGAKSLQSPLQRVVNQFQTTVISHTDF